jgi:predicted Zn-dependent protease
MGEQRWSEALAAAHQLCAATPDEPGGFIHAAYCLHEMNRTQEALNVLKNGPKSLRMKAVFFYNLGCYSARLGDIDEAMRHLQRSFEMKRDLRKLAERDPDLAGLRELLR